MVASVDGLLPIWPTPGISPGRSTNPAGQTPGKKHHRESTILLLKQQFFFSQSDFEIPGNPQSVLDPGDTSHFKAGDGVVVFIPQQYLMWTSAMNKNKGIKQILILRVSVPS